MPLRVVFFGTPQFAAQVLQFLLDHHIHVVSVVTRTDKPMGRSREPLPSSVKKLALERGLPLYQPEKVSDDQFLPVLKSFEADLFVVVAYGEILKQAVLDTPKKGCINLHASLLPKYRGAAPIQQAIIHGEYSSGATVMHMVKKMDAGAMIAKVEVPIGPDMTYGELEQSICNEGSLLLLQAIRLFEQGMPAGIPQEESEVTFAPKIELEDCGLDPEKSVEVLHNLVRGVNPEPGAWIQVKVGGQDKRLKIFKTRPQFHLKMQKGLVGLGEGKKVLLGCAEGSLELLEVQLEGKKKVTGIEFLNGLPQKQCFVSHLSVE